MEDTISKQAWLEILEVRVISGGSSLFFGPSFPALWVKKEVLGKGGTRIKWLLSAQFTVTVLKLATKSCFGNRSYVYAVEVRSFSHLLLWRKTITMYCCHFETNLAVHHSFAESLCALSFLQGDAVKFSTSQSRSGGTRITESTT